MKIIICVIFYLPAKKSPDLGIPVNPVEWIMSIFIQSVSKMETRTLPQLIYKTVITVATNITWTLYEKKSKISYDLKIYQPSCSVMQFSRV